ncbi:MAG: VWA domain-containing protein [Kangiellaceae bacterium]|nr:VWA domain-containing protein [Kangiellaceae bacterium]
MGFIKVAAWLALTLLITANSYAKAANQSDVKKSDVRLLIDISGSMKKNDPNNLRIPALQLVTNLLPKGADAGVWAFGRYVNMMVPLSTVDNKWQVNATNTANKINSRGLFTNIGSVLEKASYGWSKPDLYEKRSMVLLTDGMVDISKNPKVNAKERAKILNTILPKLKKAGVAIHTIALSENADHDLLQQLSKQTDGWYEAVNNADELQRVFLKIFEQAAARDSLPISENKFTVDSSIDEMTVLVFRKSSDTDAKLISPTGKAINKSTKGTDVRWFSTDGYDLITLQNPETGEWKIDADVDPDNRVMIVSKLGLSVSDVPNNLLAGEAINYELQMLEEGNVITKQDFLKLVDARLEQSKGGQKSKMAMFYDSGSHTFKQNFFTDSFEGELKLKLLVKSPTFERIRTHAINIYGSPLVVDLEISEDNLAPHRIHLGVREDIVQANSLVVNITMSMPNGEKSFFAIEDITKPIEIQPDLTGGDYSVEFKITGRSILNREFEVNPDAIEFSGKSLLAEQTITPISEKESRPVELEASQSNDKTSPDVEAKSEPVEEIIESPTEIKTVEEEAITEKQPIEEAETNWLYWGLGINLILGIIGFLVWRLIKKKNSKGVSDLANELGIEDEDDEDDEDK